MRFLSPSVRNQGNRSWRKKQGYREGPAKWAPSRSGRPGPTPLTRLRSAEVSGNGVWGSRRPEFRVHPHRQLWPRGLCSLRLSGVLFFLRGTLMHWEVVTVRTCGHARLAPRTSRRCPRAHASWGRRPPSSPAPWFSLPGYIMPIGRRFLGQPITGGGALWREAKSRGT